MTSMDKENDRVTTVCYGETRVWDSRGDAEAFFLEAMKNSEGSEHQRYANVYYGIIEGLEPCTDED